MSGILVMMFFYHFFVDRAHSHSHLDLDTAIDNDQPRKRSVSAFNMALGHIWKKAAHIIRVKDDLSVYLLVHGFRDDALNDFKSFRPKHIWVNDNDDSALVGQFGNKAFPEIRVRMSSTKGGSLPLLDVWDHNGVDTTVTSVVYCDSFVQMDNVYNFVTKYKFLDFD